MKELIRKGKLPPGSTIYDSEVLIIDVQANKPLGRQREKLLIQGSRTIMKGSPVIMLITKK